MPNPPMDLSALLAVVLDIFATFLIVSYVASAATEALSSAFKVRAHLLMRNIRELLNETHNSAPVTLDIYNNLLFNPRAAGKAESLAAVTIRPMIVDPLTFARALMDVVPLRGNDPGAMKQAIISSKLDVALKDLANDLVDRRATEIARADLNDLQVEIANWFETSTGQLADEYRRLTQASNFIIGLLLAVLLGLHPLPDSLVGSGLLAETGKKWPIRLLDYLVVATSTLFGAPFWFALISKIVPIKPTGVSPDAAAKPPPAVSSNGGSPTATPPEGPSPSGPTPAPPTVAPGPAAIIQS